MARCWSQGRQWLSAVSTALSSTELFDPATGTWSNARSLDAAGLTPRMAHTASLLPDGRVLVVGGQASPYRGAGGVDL